MKSTRLQLIEDEEKELWDKKGELNILKEKWIKTPSVLRKIEALENYVQLKKEFIDKLGVKK